MNSLPHAPRDSKNGYLIISWAGKWRRHVVHWKPHAAAAERAMPRARFKHGINY
jgi:hypothetical protein